MKGTKTRRSEDLGSMGESCFQLLAKDAGFVANASTDDKAGWDFEVEVPSPLSLDYAQQSRPVYRIQVKATASTDPVVSMTFSSLLSLIQYGGPAFIFFARFGTDLMPASVYLLHIDEKKALEILVAMRMREVANPGLKLNKSKYSLRFEQSTIFPEITGLTLRKRFDQALNGPYLNYLDVKTKWLRKIEEDNRGRRFNIQFENEHAVQKMADCFLGYETPFNVCSTEFKAPMGIPDQAVMGDAPIFGPTSVKPLIEKSHHALIRLRTSEFGPSYDFNGIIYTVPKQLPKEFAALRIQTALFDLVFRLSGRTTEFKMADLAADSLRAQVKEVRGFVKYMGETSQSTNTYFEVLPVDGSSPLRLSLENEHTQLPDDFDRINASIEALYMKLASLGLAEEKMRSADLLEQQSYFEFLLTIGSSYTSPLLFDFSEEPNEEIKEQAGVEAVVFATRIPLLNKIIICYGAFYGSVEKIENGRFRGAFMRSEYLGEIIIPVGQDTNTIQKERGDQFRETVRQRGYVVM